MAQNNTNDVDEVLKSIKQTAGFLAYIIMNCDGVVVRHDPLPYEEAVQHASLALNLYSKSQMSAKSIFVSP